MISELKNAFEDVFSNKIKGLVFLSILFALIVFVLLFFGFSYSLSFLQLSDLPKVRKAVEILGYILFFGLSLVLFPSVIALFAGFFIDSVTDRMAGENEIASLRTIPLSESLVVSGVVTLKGIALSLCLIPVTLVLGWIPLVNFLPAVLYYVLNGWLLAREYFFAVALRYTERPEAEDLFNRYRIYWIRSGIVIAVLMTVPLVNFVSPLVAAAFMRRLFLIKSSDRNE